MHERVAWTAMLAVLGIGCSVAPMEPSDWSGNGGDAGGSGGSGGSGQNASSSPSSTNPFGSPPTLWGAGGTAATTSSAASNNPCDGPAVSWQTSTVSLTADAFWIVANGQCYTSRGAAVQVHSDPGWSQYTTLELVWTELGREMRYFIYFTADANAWGSNEMRTYNGQKPYGDWLYYYGRFFASPIGKAFHGDVDLANDPADAIRGELHMHGLTLTTTLTGR